MSKGGKKRERHQPSNRLLTTENKHGYQREVGGEMGEIGDRN